MSTNCPTCGQARPDEVVNVVVTYTVRLPFDTEDPEEAAREVVRGQLPSSFTRDGRVSHITWGALH